MNGLGFANRPLSLSPQFFINLPLEHLFPEGVQASHFNRHKLGRTLDQCFELACQTDAQRALDILAKNMKHNLK